MNDQPTRCTISVTPDHTHVEIDLGGNIATYAPRRALLYALRLLDANAASTDGYIEHTLPGLPAVRIDTASSEAIARTLAEQASHILDDHDDTDI